MIKLRPFFFGLKKSHTQIFSCLVRTYPYQTVVCALWNPEIR